MNANSLEVRDAVLAGYAEADRILEELETEWTQDEHVLAARTVVNKLDPKIQRELKKITPDAFSKVMGGRNGVQRKQ